MSNRYKLNLTSEGCDLIDSETNHIVGSDYCEPEDASLTRHFSWVLEALNDKEDEIVRLKKQLQRS
jgi:hypothetical protein